MLTLIDGQIYELRPTNLILDPIQLRVTEPIQSQASAVLHVNEVPLHGVKYYVLNEKGSLDVRIDPNTGKIAYKGRGSATIRAILDGKAWNETLVVN